MGLDDLRRWEDFGGKVGQHCRECEERHIGCHSTCEKYLKAKDEHETYSKMIQRNRDQQTILYRHKIKSMTRENNKRRH